MVRSATRLQKCRGLGWLGHSEPTDPFVICTTTKVKTGRRRRLQQRFAATARVVTRSAGAPSNISAASCDAAPNAKERKRVSETVY